MTTGQVARGVTCPVRVRSTSANGRDRGRCYTSPAVPERHAGEREPEERAMREQLRIGAWAIVIAGVLLLLTSLFADPLALGRPGTGFGWKQAAGSIAGALIALGGFWLARRLERPRPPRQPRPPGVGPGARRM